METINSTVDLRDINHFNEISKAEQWRVVYKTLLKMNAVRVPFIVNVAKECSLSISKDESKILEGIKILDVGCGAGFLSEALVELGAHVIGIDPANECVRVATTHAQNNEKISPDKINFINITIEEFYEKHKNYFDLVVASEVIEHVFNPELFLRCCVETLKPGHPIVITTITRSWYSWYRAIFIFEYFWKIAPIGTHDWNKFITPEELKVMFKQFNCELRNAEGMDFSYLQDKWYITKNPSVFYMTYAVKN